MMDFETGFFPVVFAFRLEMNPIIRLNYQFMRKLFTDAILVIQTRKYFMHPNHE